MGFTLPSSSLFRPRHAVTQKTRHNQSSNLVDWEDVNIAAGCYKSHCPTLLLCSRWDYSTMQSLHQQRRRAQCGEGLLLPDKRRRVQFHVTESVLTVSSQEVCQRAARNPQRWQTAHLHSLPSSSTLSRHAKESAAMTKNQKKAAKKRARKKRKLAQGTLLAPPVSAGAPQASTLRYDRFATFPAGQSAPPKAAQQQADGTPLKRRGRGRRPTNYSPRRQEVAGCDCRSPSVCSRVSVCIECQRSWRVRNASFPLTCCRVCDRHLRKSAAGRGEGGGGGGDYSSEMLRWLAFRGLSRSQTEDP